MKVTHPIRGRANIFMGVEITYTGFNRDKPDLKRSVYST